MFCLLGTFGNGELLVKPLGKIPTLGAAMVNILYVGKIGVPLDGGRLGDVCFSNLRDFCVQDDSKLGRFPVIPGHLPQKILFPLILITGV